MANWAETKEKLKQKINEIAEDNLFAVKEQKDELLSKLEAKLGKTREAIIKIIAEM